MTPQKLSFLDNPDPGLEVRSTGVREGGRNQMGQALMRIDGISA
jgi:hypothetical protein